jgi:3-oxoacyl-[acyl-carrier protein] reductase
MSETPKRPRRRNPVMRPRAPLLPPSKRSRVALGLTAAATRGRFELQVCPDCGTVQYPPRDACHRCLSVELKWRPQSGKGELISETVLHHSYEAYFRDRLPWRLGMVRLDCGPTVIAHLHAGVLSAPCRVRIVARLDQAGEAALIAVDDGHDISERSADMAGDPHLQEMTCGPDRGRTEVNERYALVTGASSGIGAATAKAFLETGYHVVCLSRGRFESSSDRVYNVEVDLSDAAATHQAAIEVAGRFPITTIVHNAGAIREKPLLEVTLDDLEALTHLHVAAAISLVQAALPTMKQQHFGRIVLVSTRAVLGLAKRTVYSATKAALLGLTRTWALELGEHGITVNAVAPGPIEATRMFHEIIPQGSPKLPRITESIPVKRLGRPEDVARAVLFLAAPEAGFITGQTLFVCGGTSVGSVVY